MSVCPEPPECQLGMSLFFGVILVDGRVRMDSLVLHDG